MDQRAAAANAFTEAIIRYLHKPTEQLKAVMETKMETYSNHLNQPGALEDLQETIMLLESGDEETWVLIQRGALFLIENDPELKILFIKAAQKHNLNNFDWVI